MTTPLDDEIFSDLFHSCALTAYLEQAAETGTWPDANRTRQRAYRLYEEALRERNTTVSPKK